MLQLDAFKAFLQTLFISQRNENLFSFFADQLWQAIVAADGIHLEVHTATSDQLEEVPWQDSRRSGFHGHKREVESFSMKGQGILRS